MKFNLSAHLFEVIVHCMANVFIDYSMDFFLAIKVDFFLNQRAPSEKLAKILIK